MGAAQIVKLRLALFALVKNLFAIRFLGMESSLQKRVVTITIFKLKMDVVLGPLMLDFNASVYQVSASQPAGMGLNQLMKIAMTLIKYQMMDVLNHAFLKLDGNVEIKFALLCVEMEFLLDMSNAMMETIVTMINVPTNVQI